MKTSGARSGSGALTATGRHANTRSKVTNGQQMFVAHNNLQSSTGRRWRDIVELIAVDLGGPDKLSEFQKQLIRRAASLAVACETMEADLVREMPVDLSAYGQLSDRLRRICETLGIDKAAPPAETLPTSLADYKPRTADE